LLESILFATGLCMPNKLLLVDYENVQQIDLSRLDNTTHVLIFVGASQKTVPVELVMATQQLGSRIEWQKVEGNGNNALDFHIACHLGRLLETSPATKCIVLSKDKGFDPLLRQLNKSGLKCLRINSLMELNPKPAQADDPNYQRVIDNLSKSKKNRPRKRQTLSKHIAAMFNKTITQQEIDRIIDTLFAKNMVSETNNTISYGF
jgi:hypothetical protein